MTGGLLAVAGLCLLVAFAFASRFPRLSTGTTVLGSVLGLVAALGVLWQGSDWEWVATWRLGGEAPHLRLDGLAAWFLVLVCLVGACGAVYALDYWSATHYPRSAAKGRRWWNLLALSMALVTLCSNGLHFLMAWEAFAVSGYFLITLEKRTRAVRDAGWLYLAASHVGTLALFGFFVALSQARGSWELGPIAELPGGSALFWLMVFGFGLKAGFVPCHVWLPSAHANAPSHVSAFLSGVAIKMGVYGIFRFSSWLPVPEGAGVVLLGLGALTALWGIVFAAAQDDVKRLLAYCSVENVGIILAGLGAALLAQSQGQAVWGTLALAGALLHVWNHAVFKALLFLAAGSVLHATGTRRMSRLGGLWRRMPFTAAMFALGAVAVSGLPPLNGFISEWLILLGLFDGSLAGNLWVSAPAILLLAAAGALALAVFVKASAMLFLGAHKTPEAAQAHEASSTMLGPLMVLALLCLLVGLRPELILRPLHTVVQRWDPATSPDPGLFGPVSAVPLTLACLALLASVGLIFWVRRNGLRRAVTWDCGYAAPTARMQYTSGSFARTVGGWFSWLLRPTLRLRRPRGFFPDHARRLEEVPDLVLVHAVGPIARVFRDLSSAVTRLQHGRLQAYIFYLLVGLFLLGLLVVLGGRP